MSKKMMIFLFAVIICLSLAETKIPLSKEELRKIDWYGENAGQYREQWIYKDIYEIHGTEKTEAVAVQINDRYYIAKRQ